MWSLPYGVKRIAQYGRSRATLDATECHHWALGKYSPRIAPADAMVINFGVKNQGVALRICCSKASVQKAQNKPSSQLIKATGCVERVERHD
jgi:hypothetical protein